MSRLPFSLTTVTPSFPRVSGDEPPQLIVVEVQLPFSPRERG